MSARARIQRLLNWKTATAEFLILVVGILLALAVDRWANDYRDAQTASKYIAQLRSDVAIDLAGHEESLVWSNVIDGSALYVLQVYRGRDPGPEEYDQLAHHIYRAAWVGTGRSTTTTYDDLVSTGNMALLPVHIRDAITRYYGIKSAYERRLTSLGDAAWLGYWRVPERVLGPDLAPAVWLGIQGRTADFSVAQGDLGLSEADARQIIDRLRDVADLETFLAEVRHHMAQQTVLFGDRLPKAARELESALQHEVEPDAMN